MNYKDGLHKHRSIEQEKLEVLTWLYQHDIWDERLMSDILFGNTVETVLEPREKFILEMKVEGKNDKHIWHVLNQNAPKGMSFATYERMYRSIKQKLREGMNQELPGWIRSQYWLEGEDDIKPDKLWEELP